MDKKPHRLPRPFSDSLAAHYASPEAQGNFLDKASHVVVVDKWFEDLSLYEGTLHQIVHTQTDDAFKEELKAIQQWFNVLSENERTAALYSLLRNLNLEQIRFFMTVLQQMASKETVGLGVSTSKEAASPKPSRKGKLGGLMNSV